ncbi:hypothetical protein PHYPSEUDO_010442 [Phytophthora pseudosyringae]|uniref:Ankyrin repeat protein n=1 Tax=Phytophthora pseudosyringae TaxID=221518 RepID=A0A8T1VDM1_9STRA|nr:hypothetical protein PHYPSEUDO_010442 [Phytophthora pseudosyringae]
MASDVPALLAVELLFRPKAKVTDLAHVLQSVSLFLDAAVELPLHKACALGSLQLLDRIWAASKVFSKHNTKKNKIVDGSWTLRKLIKTDKVLLSISVQSVPGGGGQEQKPGDGQVALCKISRLPGQEPSEFKQKMLHGKLLRGIASTGAHQPNLRYDMNKVLDHAVKRGDIALAEWLLSHGRLDVLKWLDTEGQVQGHAGLVLVAAEKGYLGIIRWLLDHDAQSSNQHRLTDLGGEAGLAIHTAVVNGHLEVAKYLRARAQIPVNALQRITESLERVDRIRSLTRQLGGLVSVSSVSANTLVKAGKNGHLATVQWLFVEYYGDRKIKTCGGGNHSNEHSTTESTAMVAAASQGHLKVLVLLQTLEVATGIDMGSMYA